MTRVEPGLPFPHKSAELSAGVIRYRDEGEGSPLVFVHGALVNGLLWRKVTPPLVAAGYRCIVPDWPLGGHSAPMKPGADLTFPGLARLVDEFLAALDLRDVILVGNDTGGALCQYVVTAHPERIGRLVLTNCDAFEVFPPLLLRYIVWGARMTGFVGLMGTLLRFRALHFLPFTLGWLVKRRPPREVVDAYLTPVMTDPAVRRDLEKVLRGASRRDLAAVGERLRGFARPVLLTWAPEDRLFPMDLAARLAARFPDAPIRAVPDSYTFVPEDQPLLLAERIDGFLREPLARAA